MANPQPDKFTKISNELLEALYKTDIKIAPDCRKIFDMIMRYTYGYNRKWVAIKNIEFSRETGIKMPNVSRAIKKLQLMNLIVIKTDNFNDVNYSIQKNYDKWKKLSKQITVIRTDNKELSKQITSTPSKAFSDNGSGDPKESIKEIVLTKVSAKPPIPEKMNAKTITEYFYKLYRFYWEIDYVPIWGRDQKTIDTLWLKVGKNIFALIDHYLSMETNQKVFWTTKERTIGNFSWQINQVQQHWKEYA